MIVHLIHACGRRDARYSNQMAYIEPPEQRDLAYYGRHLAGALGDAAKVLGRMVLWLFIGGL